MNLDGPHRIRWKGIHKHRRIDSYRLHTCHDHCRNACKGCLGCVFCADDEAWYVINKELILPLISSFRCNELLTGFVWFLPVVNIYISGRIESSKHFIGYILGCQRRRLTFNLLPWDNIDLPTITIYGMRRCRSQLCCRDLFSKRWRGGMCWWLLADYFPEWSPKWIIVRLWIVISTIIVIVG